MATRRLLSQLVASPSASPRRSTSQLSPAALSSPLVPTSTPTSVKGGDQLTFVPSGGDQVTSPPRCSQDLSSSFAKNSLTPLAVFSPTLKTASPSFYSPSASPASLRSSSFFDSPVYSSLQNQRRFASTQALNAKRKTLNGEVLCFTGMLKGSTRADAARLAKQGGATVVPNMNQSVTALVGADPKSLSRKTIAARKKGIQLWSEKEFLGRLKNTAIVGASPRKTTASGTKHSKKSSQSLLQNLLSPSKANPKKKIPLPITSTIAKGTGVRGQKLAKQQKTKTKRGGNQSHQESLSVYAKLMNGMGEKMDREMRESLPLVADYPELCVQWKGKKGDKTFTPETERINSLIKIQWKCTNPACGHEWKSRIRDHVVDEGKCPKCHQVGDPGLENLLEKLINPQTSKRKALVGYDFGELRKRTFKPELAKSYEKDHIARVDAGKPGLFAPEDPVYVSPKLDGIRCIVRHGDTPGADPVFLSRRGHVLECCDHLVPLFKKMLEADPEAVFDGELYVHEKLEFDNISGLCRTLRKHRDEEAARKQALIQYHCFGLMYGTDLDKTTSFEDRRAPLKALTKLLSPKEREKFQVVDQHRTTIDAVQSLNAEFVAAGFEGSMVRDARIPYAFGQRSNSLLKVKTFHDSEYEIVGFKEGTGEWKGHLGSYLCRDKKTGTTFNATPAVPTAEKKEIWENKQAALLGKMLTVTYFETSKDGVPRFPVGKSVRGAKSKKDWL